MSTLSEQLFDAVQNARDVPREIAEKLLIDVAGLCVAARRTGYVRASLAGWEASGSCTAIGHSRTLDAAGAAFVNGTAAHGEDFDDTFEGGPVHAGAVVVPAVLAVAEREHLGGRDALLGIAVGVEVICRAPASSARAPCSRAPTACSTASRAPPRATGTSWWAASASAGWRIRSPSSFTPAAR